jgi:hypothetical protein
MNDLKIVFLMNKFPPFCHLRQGKDSSKRDTEVRGTCRRRSKYSVSRNVLDPFRSSRCQFKDNSLHTLMAAMSTSDSCTPPSPFGTILEHSHACVRVTVVSNRTWQIEGVLSFYKCWPVLLVINWTVVCTVPNCCPYRHALKQWPSTWDTRRRLRGYTIPS